MISTFDPLQDLVKRFTGIEQGYVTSDAAAIAKHLIQTAQYDGPNLVTCSGSVEVTPDRSTTFDRRAISECLVELANSFQGFDMQIVPLETRHAVSFDDDFTAGSIDAKWTQTLTGSGALAINSGRLRATKSTSAGSAEIRSHPLTTGGPSMNMRGRVLTAFVEDTTANAADHAGIRIRYVHTSTSTWWDLTRRVGNIVARQEQSGSGGDIATVASSAQWLRIREEGGTVYFEYSSDGTAWTLLTSVNPNGTSLTQMTTASVQAGLLQGTSSSAATVDIDNLKLSPPPLGQLNLYARLGQFQADLPFGWKVPPYNIANGGRLRDGMQVMNDLTVIGAAELESRQQDATSQTQIGLMQGRTNFADITNLAYLDALAQEELQYRLQPRELVSFVPVNLTYEPWTHFNVGDTVPVYIGAGARGGFEGIMRIYGFTVNINDEGVEQLSNLILSPEA
jgi:hypothetical protein